MAPSREQTWAATWTATRWASVMEAPWRVVHERHPNDFYTTNGGRARIDYVYCPRLLYDCVVSDRIVSDDYTTPVQNPQKISNFWSPSDHRPIIVDFDFD